MVLDRAMLLGAQALLRVVAPPRALRVLRALGAGLPRLRSAAEMRTALTSVRGRGTCLSRSLAVAARAPEARVVIGVDPTGRECGFAHAWLEYQGFPLEPGDVAGRVIARMPAIVDEPKRQM
jgi:hypothetical protein